MGSGGSKVDNYNSEAATPEDGESRRRRRDSTEEKYGPRHGHDPEFSGPIHVGEIHALLPQSYPIFILKYLRKDRSCTDVLCLLLFVVFLVCWAITGIWAFTKGDPNRLVYPSNSNGEVCGRGDYRLGLETSASVNGVSVNRSFFRMI